LIWLTGLAGLGFGVRRLNRQLTALTEAQEAVRASEHMLAEAQRIAHMGSWDWDIVENTLFWSDEIYRIFGVPPHEFGATYEAFLGFVHPEDKKDVIKSVDEALYDGKPYSIDHRILKSDGSERFVHEQGEVTFNDDGKAIRMIGTVRDITERKIAGQERERLIDELQKALASVKQLSGFLPICSSCKKIRDDNGYWTQIEGYIRDHSEADFSHGICPECAKKLYPDFDLD